MLRNLVTSLLKHERIKTTLPKARDAARLAEKIITLGKKGDLPSHRRAGAFLLESSLLPKLFTTFASRYATRPGGYTRIHKYGNRPGDNAPHAVLELVDNPRDVKFEMTARAVGFEAVSHTLEHGSLSTAVKEGMGEQVRNIVEAEKGLPYEQSGLLKQKTRLNMQKVLRYRGSEGEKELMQKAKEHSDRLLAKPVAFLGLNKDSTFRKAPSGPVKPAWFNGTATRRPGAIAPVEPRARGSPQVLEIAQGALARPRIPRWRTNRPKLGIDTAQV